MEQDNLEQLSSKKKSGKLASIFEALRLKHLILFILCLLFLGILVSGGSQEKEPRKLAIKKKKKHNQVAQNTKELTVVEKAKAEAAEIKEEATEAAENAIEKAKQGFNQAAEATKETTADIKEKAAQSIKNLKQQVEEKVGIQSTQPNQKEITDISHLNKAPKSEVRDIAKIEEVPDNKKESGSFKDLFGKNKKESNSKKKNSVIETEANQNKTLKTDAPNTLALKEVENLKKEKPNLAIQPKAQNNKQKDEEQKNKTENVEQEAAQPAADWSKLNAEINSLKQQVEQLSSQIKNTPNEKSTLLNDTNMIEERIKFWQSMKEKANSY